MGKQGKSSASSATRKKHAKKAAAQDPSIAIAPAAKSQGKGKGKKNKEPKVKQYIPPPKYKPLVEDPIESLAIASILPPNMVLCFKGLSKKDPVTKTKALEELGGLLDDENWPAALPVWLWHFVPLSVHPSRRLRELAATFHSKLLDRPNVRDEIQSYVLRDPAAGTFLAAWALGANDTVPAVATALRASWNSSISWYFDSPEGQLIDIQDHVDDMVSNFIQAVVDPEQLYRQFAPLLAHATKDGSDSLDITGGEHAQDRDARLRTTGLNTVSWILEGPPNIMISSITVVLNQLLSSNPTLGTILSSSDQPPFLASPASTSWGHGQRGVRMSGWNLVKVLVKRLQQDPAVPSTEPFNNEPSLAHKTSFLANLGVAALRSAWTETDAGVRLAMWEGVLPLITVFPEVWETTPQPSQIGETGNDDPDSEGDEDDAMETPLVPEIDSALTLPSGQLAYEDFLRFLELGCYGSAIQSYPAAVIVLSTLPPTIFALTQEGLERFFVSFWAAYDSKALNVLPRDREPTLKAWLSALLDCIVFVSRRLHATSSRSQEPVNNAMDPSSSNLILVPINWLATVLTELVDHELSQNLSQSSAGALVGASLKKLELLDPGMIEQAWTMTWEPIFSRQLRPHQTSSKIKLLVSIGSLVPDSISEKRIDLILQRMARMDFAEAENLDPLSEKAEVLISFWQSLDPSHAPWLVEITPSILDDELTERLLVLGDSRGIADLSNGFLNSSAVPESVRRDIWAQVVGAVIRTSRFDVFRKILESIRITLPLITDGSELHAICESWIDLALQGKPDHSQDITTLLVHWDVCFTESQAIELMKQVLSAFIAGTQELLFGTRNAPGSPKIEVVSQILSGIFASDRLQQFWDWANIDWTRVGASLIILSALPNLSHPVLTRCKQARDFWSLHAPSKLQFEATAQAKELIRSLLMDSTATLSAPDVLVVAARSVLYEDEKVILTEVFPSPATFNLELRNLDDNPSLVLAEADPLVSLDEREPSSTALSTYDNQGFSKFVRLGSALSTILSEERHLARENLWTFRYLLALQQLCTDFTSAPFWPSDAIQQSSVAEARSLLELVTPLVIYLGNSLYSDLSLDWHKQLVSKLQMPDLDSGFARDAQSIVTEAYSIVTQGDASSRDTRLLRRVVQFALRDSEPDVLELWAGLAQSSFTQYPKASDAIGSVLSARGIESPRLDRWRNEVASRIPSVSTNKINDVGLTLLRTLHCLAPPPESGIIFMPQQRAVFLVQALQKWMASDEDLDTSIELRITIAINHLLPILQTVPGAHWDFILDVLENNLSVEGNSANLYLLLETLRGITSVQELAKTNKTLKEIWKPRQKEILRGILQLFLDTRDEQEESETRRKFHTCLAEAIQMLPPEETRGELFDQLLLLTSRRSTPIKTAAHYLARKALSQITEERVLEAAINPQAEGDAEESPVDKKFELPQGLIDKLTSPTTTPAGYAEDYLDLLLSWWIALEFFDNSSIKVKQGYLDQLRKLNLVKASLLPCLFSLLHIETVGEKPFNLAPWLVEEFYLDLYDNSMPDAINVLAAYIYFKSLKSVPGLIRTWYSECQDRQLSSSLASYTKTHFSPVLIKHELTQFRSSAASASEALADENFTLKVVPSVNEISASYAVDEQDAFEVAIRLPSEFPLRAAEVRDVRGVAGMENRRRSWVFGVQHAAQQGLIYDALVVYKKNVAGHFEGKSECAICYSLISVTDRTLPTKPCRTCKNLFHASCLYKWFNTSHTSTCPLCRSDIF